MCILDDEIRTGKITFLVNSANYQQDDEEKFCCEQFPSILVISMCLMIMLDLSLLLASLGDQHPTVARK